MGNRISTSITNFPFCGSTEVKFIILSIPSVGVGKTTIVRSLLGEDLTPVFPTMGYTLNTLNYQSRKITIIEIGGGSKLPPIYKYFFSEVQGFIFVVDAADRTQCLISEAKNLLHFYMQHEDVERKPLLVLVNKQDVPGAMTTEEATEYLNIQSIRVPCLLLGTSVLQNPNGLCVGLDWLLNHITY